MNIIFENKKYGYEDYQKFVEKLTSEYVDPKSIAVVLKRTPQLLFLLYYFKNGLTYIPIDYFYPNERIQYILEDSKPVSIILDSTKNLSYNPKHKNDSSGIAFNDTISYILYTSGSTGTPKGVMITLEGLNNFIDGISEIIDFSKGKRMACFTTFSFDIFFLESIMALQKGLTVVLANEDEQRNPKLMAKLIQNNAVDMIQMTPSRMQLLLNHDKELSCLQNVKEIMIGGESFPLSLLKTLQEKTSAKIYNMYEPTETTIWSAVSDLTVKKRIDIGHPIKNTEIYIVDENLYILPSGQAGEICISGKGLAKGYVGRDNLTSEKFLCLPQKPDIKVYRTGDMGRYLPDGDLEYLGRTDNQVKIRGHRIELEEIENHINQYNGIKQSVVVALEISETDKILNAFFTSENEVDSKDIKDYLSLKLPDYMIPVRFKRVEEFIQTVNGKIDRKRVLECIEIKSNEVASDTSIYDELPVVQKRAFDIIISNFKEKKKWKRCRWI
jgi:amino acid adenylation domain-containing protein